MRYRFNHLYYFWAVVRAGGVVKAADALALTPQTLSGQLKELQGQFPQPLLRKVGRQLELTSLGERVYEVAEQMFAQLEQLDTLMEKGENSGLRRFKLGALDILPKTLVTELLAPVFALKPAVQLSVKELGLDAMLEGLGRGQLDGLLTDRPVSSAVGQRTQSHQLLVSQMGVFAPSAVKVSPVSFPQSLGALPALLPGPTTYSRRLIDQWLHGQGLAPRVVAELEDSALLRPMAKQVGGYFFAPITEVEALTARGFTLHGRCEDMDEVIYLVTLAKPRQAGLIAQWLSHLAEVAYTAQA